MQRLCSQAVLARTTRLREQHSEEAVTTRLWEELSLATKMQQTLSGVGEQAGLHAHPKLIRAAAAWRTRTPTPHPSPSPGARPSPQAWLFELLKGSATLELPPPLLDFLSAHIARHLDPYVDGEVRPRSPRHTPRPRLPGCREAARAGWHAACCMRAACPCSRVCVQAVPRRCRHPKPPPSQAAAIPSRHPPGLHAR